MRQLIIYITLLLLFPLENSTLFAQGRNLAVPVTRNADDNIDLPYNGRWGWHKVHMRPLRRFQLESPLTSSRKIDLCFQCHEKDDYRKCDPHTQLNKDGEIIKEKCLYCHKKKPDEKSADFTAHPGEILFNRDPETLCLGCHNSTYYIAHPVNAKHLIKPSDEMLSMMKKTEEQYSIVLPLNTEGEIMCATCHNPHEKGVIPSGREAAGGAGEKDRIRLPGPADRPAAAARADQYMTRVESFENKICMACHKDKSEIEK